MRIAMIAAAIAAAGASHAVEAAPILWTLNGVTFSDGGTATGSFVYDAAINRYSNPSITVTPFAAAGLPAYTYGPSSVILNASATGVDLLGPDTYRFLRLRFGSTLSDAGGTVALTGASVEGDQNGDTRVVVGGTVSASAVPEPASWALMLAGFGAVGYTLRRGRAPVRRSAAPLEA